MAQWTRMARLWCDEGTSIAGNPNFPAAVEKPKSMKSHHASRDREQGGTTSARSRAMRTPASVTGIAVVMTAAVHAQNPAGTCNREPNATHP
jgi:hypothetical protein